MKNLISTLLLLVASSALAGDKDVIVINTPDVTVTNNKANPASVLVENGIAEPVPVVNVMQPGVYAREPFSFGDAFSNSDEITYYTVPDDKILVITAVSSFANNVACDQFAFDDVQIRPPSGATSSDRLYIFLPLEQATACEFERKDMVGASNFNAFIDPGSRLQIRRISNAGFSRINIYGYLVPEQSPTLSP